MPRSQAIQVEQIMLFSSPPTTTSFMRESSELIPSRQVSEMAPPINPYEIMSWKTREPTLGKLKGKGKSKDLGQSKKG